MRSDQWLTEIVKRAWQHDHKEFPPPKMDLQKYLREYPCAATYVDHWSNGQFWECILDFLGIFGASEVLQHERSEIDTLRAAVLLGMDALHNVSHRLGWDANIKCHITRADAENLGSMATSVVFDYNDRTVNISLNFGWTEVEETPWTTTIRLVFHEFRHAVQNFLGLLTTKTTDEFHPCELDARLFQEVLFDLLHEDVAARRLRGGFENLQKLRDGMSLFAFDDNWDPVQDLQGLSSLLNVSTTSEFTFYAPFVEHLRSRILVFAALYSSQDIVSNKRDGQYTLQDIRDAIERFNLADRTAIPFIAYGSLDWYQARIEEYKGYLFQRLAKFSTDKIEGRQYLIQSVLCMRRAGFRNPESRLCKYIGLYIWQYKIDFHAITFLSEYVSDLSELVQKHGKLQTGLSLQIGPSDFKTLLQWPKGFDGCDQIQKKYLRLVSAESESDLVLDFYLYGSFMLCTYPELTLYVQNFSREATDLSELTGIEHFLACLIICERWLRILRRNQPKVFSNKRLNIDKWNNLESPLRQSLLFSDPWPDNYHTPQHNPGPSSFTSGADTEKSIARVDTSNPVNKVEGKKNHWLGIFALFALALMLIGSNGLYQRLYSPNRWYFDEFTTQPFHVDRMVDGESFEEEIQGWTQRYRVHRYFGTIEFPNAEGDAWDAGGKMPQPVTNPLDKAKARTLVAREPLYLQLRQDHINRVQSEFAAEDWPKEYARRNREKVNYALKNLVSFGPTPTYPKWELNPERANDPNAPTYQIRGTLDNASQVDLNCIVIAWVSLMDSDGRQVFGEPKQSRLAINCPASGKYPLTIKTWVRPPGRREGANIVFTVPGVESVRPAEAAVIWEPEPTPTPLPTATPEPMPLDEEAQTPQRHFENGYSLWTPSGWKSEIGGEGGAEIWNWTSQNQSFIFVIRQAIKSGDEATIEDDANAFKASETDITGEIKNSTFAGRPAIEIDYIKTREIIDGQWTPGVGPKFCFRAKAYFFHAGGYRYNVGYEVKSYRLTYERQPSPSLNIGRPNKAQKQFNLFQLRAARTALSSFKLN